MKPVICFFESESYIYSTDYRRLACPDHQSVTDFLQQIELQFKSEMKIIQINFEAYENKKSSTQKVLYPSQKANVFILKSFEILSLREIQMKHTNLLREKSESLKDTRFELLVKKKEFIENVKKIKTWIAEGRFYQVNLTAAFKAELAMDSLQFFLTISSQFSGAFKCHLPIDNYSLISFSPELFLEKKQNRLRTAPIKGSLGLKNKTQEKLLDIKKEEAELSMIVDLLRNDLNSLEIATQAVVTEHRQLMNLNYIQHTYSEIQISTEKNLPYILEKLMPGGSISGCPKKESLLVIQELEPYQRQAYTGIAGWWNQGEFKLNISIRSFVQSKENYFYFSGCGIVYDSDPEQEFAELLNKTGNLNVHYT